MRLWLPVFLEGRSCSEHSTLAYFKTVPRFPYLPKAGRHFSLVFKVGNLGGGKSHNIVHHQPTAIAQLPLGFSYPRGGDINVSAYIQRQGDPGEDRGRTFSIPFTITHFSMLCAFLLIGFRLILKVVHGHCKKLWKNQKSMFFNCYIYNPFF